MPLLEIRGLHVRYGNIEAVRGVTLDLAEGEIVTLIGGNGAGKSTTLKAISGLLKPSAGQIFFRGERIDGLEAHEVVGLGIVQVPEGRHIFPRMSVEENLKMGAHLRTDTAQMRKDLERVYGMFGVLSERARQPGGTLSGGEQQQLAIGRALMSRPGVMLLDEPSMGLAPLLVEQIFQTIAEINREGTTLLLVEQNAQMALSVANRGYVMESGSISISDSGQALLTNPNVRKAYLGVA